MSDDAASGLDPRFDPRYQRGYVGSDSADAPAAPGEQRSPSTEDPLPLRRQGVERPAAAGADASASTDAPFGSAASTPEAPGGNSGSGVVAGDGTDHDDQGFETDAVAVLEPEPEPDSVPRWFAAAWAILGVSLIVGLAVTWATNSDPATYTGINSNDLLRQISWMVAPNLVRFGLLGAVGLTVWIGVRQIQTVQRARAAAQADQAGAPTSQGAHPRVLPRVPAVAVLFSLIGAGTVVFIWWASVSTDRDIYNYSAAPSEEQLSAMAVAQTAGAVIGPVIEMALWSVFGLIVLGASAAMAHGGHRNAPVSAGRARSAPPDRP